MSCASNRLSAVAAVVVNLVTTSIAYNSAGETLTHFGANKTAVIIRRAIRARVLYGLPVRSALSTTRTTAR